MSVENKLQLEYLELVDDLSKVQEYIEIEIQNIIKTHLLKTDKTNQIFISSRVKKCPSAITSLKKRLDKKEFVENEAYSITQLKDLIGIRISVFPFTLLEQIKQPLLDYLDTHFLKSYITDHAHLGNYDIYKFRGSHKKFSNFNCEIQLIPVLVHKFWDTEHAILYKAANLKDNTALKKSYTQVIKSLHDFETAHLNSINQLNNENSTTTVKENSSSPLQPKFYLELERKKNELKTHLEYIAYKANKLRKEGHLSAAKKAAELHKMVTIQSEIYFSNPTAEAYNVFKHKTKQDIEAATSELNKQRGWKKILANIALTILSFGVFYLITVLINRNTFFNSTDTFNRVKNLQKSIENDCYKIAIPTHA